MRARTINGTEVPIEAKPQYIWSLPSPSLKTISIGARVHHSGGLQSAYKNRRKAPDLSLPIITQGFNPGIPGIPGRPRRPQKRRPGEACAPPALQTIILPKVIQNEIHVLVAPSAEVNQNGSLGLTLRKFNGISHRMRTFQGWNDSFEATQFKKGIDGFLIVDYIVSYFLQIVQHTVLGTNTRVVQSTGYRVNGTGLIFFILQQVALKTMNDAWLPMRHGSCMVTNIHGTTPRLNAVQVTLIVI